MFYKLLYGQKAYSNQQYNANPDSDLPPEKPVAERSTRRSIFGGRKESIVEDSGNPTDSKRSREESITGGLLRYSKSKKFKETKDTKLKLFLKRGSEPMLNGLPLHQQVGRERLLTCGTLSKEAGCLAVRVSMREHSIEEALYSGPPAVRLLIRMENEREIVERSCWNRCKALPNVLRA